MQDSTRDQTTVVAVLCAFVRDHANAATVGSGRPSASPPTSSAPSLPTDIQAALTVVGTRNPAYGGIVDLTGTDLTGTDLTGADLTGAWLYGAILTGADLFGANLPEADPAGDHARCRCHGPDLPGRPGS